jgi:hypothetical protein
VEEGEEIVTTSLATVTQGLALRRQVDAKPASGIDSTVEVAP